MRRTHGWQQTGTIAALIATTIAAASPAPAISDPDTIFANARTAWAQGGYPRYATYAVAVDYADGNRHVRSTWDTIEDFRHEIVYSRKFDREETANPGPPPTGINIAIPFLNGLTRQEPKDPVGHVAFAIDQSYGIARPAMRITAATSASAFNATSTTLALIGRTGTVARIYDIRLAETRVDAQGTSYHLLLTPLQKPEENRLRELWIDGATWLPQTAIVAGIGDRAPLTDVDWRVEFQQIQGATYIARETALADVDYGGAGMLRGLTISFAEFAAHAFPPATFAIGSSDDKPLADP
jgi:hypothetical protein